MTTQTSAPVEATTSPAPETATDTKQASVAPAAKEEQVPVPNPDIEKQRELRRQFSKLGRQEQQVKAKLAEIEKATTELQKYKEIETLVQSGKRLDALNKLNIQYDDLTRDLITNPRDPAQEKFLELQSQIAELKAERAKELERQQQYQAQQTEQAARQFVASKVKEKNAELIESIEGGMDMAYATAIQLLEAGTYKDPVKATEAAIDEVQSYYITQLEKALGTSVGKSYLDKRYEEYAKAKKAEKEKPGTLTTRTPVGTPKQDPGLSTAPETLNGFKKGSAGYMKELMKQAKLAK